MARIAGTGGTDAVDSGTVLAIGSLFGVAGASLATAFAARKGQWVLVGGYALMALAIAALFREPPLERFALAAFVLKGASTFTLPFILGRVASIDGQGRLMSITNMAIGGGLAIGPLITGAIIEFGGGIPVMIGLSVIAMLASASLILSLNAFALRPRVAAVPLEA
jgi:MFS family permease